VQPWSPCGHQNGKEVRGDGKGDNKFSEPFDGLDLPVSMNPAKWVIGQSVEVAFSLEFAHGGGYQWRLCQGVSAFSKPSNDCFQPLNFTNSRTIVRWKNGNEKTYARIDVTGSAVTPAGHPWRVIRIPLWHEKESKWFTDPPCDGCVGRSDQTNKIEQFWPFSLVDTVQVPNVKTGHAWLQWRWDNEQQDQVWTNCADVEIVSGAQPSPHPSPSPTPPAPLPVYLSRGESLHSGESLSSSSGNAGLKVQADGNLVLRDTRTDERRWHSATEGHASAVLTFRASDGNLMLSAQDGSVLWSSGYHPLGVKAQLENNCNFAVVDKDGNHLWSTGSSCSQSTYI